MNDTENMTQKADYQLKWIIANKRMYPESQIDIAVKELKRREKIDGVKNTFIKLWHFLGSIFR